LKKRVLVLAAGLCCAATFAYSQTSGIYDPEHLISPSQHGQVTTLGTGFSFTEGPAVDRHGNVFFTDQPNDKIYRWDHRNGNISLFLTGTGRANGMAFDLDGNLITCSDLHGEVWKIFPDGSHIVLVNNYNGKLLNGPNDVWINPVTGGMYFTDPIFPRGYWDAGDPRQQAWPPTHSEQAAVGKGGYVYYLPPGRHELIRVTTEAMGWDSDVWPNGIVGTPDGRRLFVNLWTGDSKGGTYEFDINHDGTLSNMRKFIDWGGDGMSMDDRGDIFISNGNGVMGFDREGNHILTIPLSQGAGTNNTFAAFGRRHRHDEERSWDRDHDGDHDRDDRERFWDRDHDRDDNDADDFNLLFITDGFGTVEGVKMRVGGVPGN
jgi:gluconolactonase